MTTSDEPRRADELERRANDAERLLLRTLDVLAERRRHVGAMIYRARTSLESGALAASAALALGALVLFRRPRARLTRRTRSRTGGFGALFLLGASVGLLSLASRMTERRVRGSR